MIIASSSLLGQRLYSLPEQERKYVYVTYPYTLPRDAQKYRASVDERMIKKGTSISRPDVQYKMYSLVSTLTGPLVMMRSYVYRDYFLELIEKTPDLTINPVIYPRISFGSGQRYVSKGCYIVQVSEGPNPDLLKKSDWVIH